MKHFLKLMARLVGWLIIGGLTMTVCSSASSRANEKAAAETEKISVSR